MLLHAIMSQVLLRAVTSQMLLGAIMSQVLLGAVMNQMLLGAITSQLPLGASLTRLLLGASTSPVLLGSIVSKVPMCRAKCRTIKRSRRYWTTDKTKSTAIRLFLSIQKHEELHFTRIHRIHTGAVEQYPVQLKINKIYPFAMIIKNVWVPSDSQSDQLLNIDSVEKNSWCEG